MIVDLYLSILLLQIEGEQGWHQESFGFLPPPPPDGYSMKALRDAASMCKLKLTGVILKRTDHCIDRPMILLLSRGKHGHFVVVRPIGRTGKLAQLLDPNRPPLVLDKNELYTSPDWTGLALVPDRPNWPARIAVSLLASALAVGLSGLGVARLRRWTKKPSTESVSPGAAEV